MKLVARDRQKIGAQIVDIKWQLASRLYGVAMKIDVLFERDSANFLQGLSRANLVVRVHDAAQDSIWSDRLADVFRIDASFAVNPQVRHFNSRLLQGLAGMKYRVMLHLRSNDVLSWPGRRLGGTTECQVVALSATAGEDDFIGLGIQQLSQLL